MATTINAANISIGMDVTKLKEGMGASRTEINQLRSILKDSIDPVDKLKSQMVLLERAFKAGAIDADQFARSMNHLKQKLSEANAAASGGGLQGLLKGQLGNLATMAAGAFTVSSVVGTAQEFDAIIDKSEQLGVSYRDLMVIGRTLEESGGISFDQAGQAISKMQLNLANARDKGGDLDNMLKSIGLSSKNLAGADAVSAFKEIQQAFGKIEGHANQVQFATELFGKAGIDMIPALQTSANQFDQMEKHLMEAGLLAPGMEGKISEAADSAARLADHFKGVSLLLVSEFGPTITSILQDIKWQVEAFQNLKKAIFGVVNEGDRIDKALGIVYDSDLLEKMTKEERQAFDDMVVRRRVEFIRREKEEAKIAQQRREAEAKVEEDQKRVLERMDKLKTTLLEEQKEREKKDREEQQLLKEKDRELDASMRSLESERQRLLGAGDKNVAATIAPAIKAGTVEAYKAVNQQNEQRAARAEQVAELRGINEKLKKIADEKAVLLTRIR